MPTQENIVTALGNMNVMELIDLTKTLEDKWGVSATPQVALAPAPFVGHIGVPEPAADHQGGA
jgi:large subunit ribosomal protein L7/L12